LTHDGGNRLQKYEWPDGTAECPRACSYSLEVSLRAPPQSDTKVLSTFAHGVA
jgi:hypothetical protein